MMNFVGICRHHAPTGEGVLGEDGALGGVGDSESRRSGRDPWCLYPQGPG